MGAQTDFESSRTREISSSNRGGIWRQFLGGAQEEQPQAYQLASPLAHLDADDPPCFFITGETDDPSTRAMGFRAKMAELGIQSELTVIDGAPHPFLGKQDWFDEMLDAADSFFKKSLRD